MPLAAGSLDAWSRTPRIAAPRAAPPRRRPAGLRRALLAAAVTALGVLAADPARAQSFMPPLVGGLTFSGPASGHVTGIYYNPAAIGLVRGTAIHLSFDGEIDTVSIDRSPIDPTTGAPVKPGTPGARSFPGVREQRFVPNGFFGLTSDFGTDNVTLGVGVYTPAFERRQPSAAQPLPAQDGPTRYHLLDLTQYHLYITPTVSLRVSKAFYVGLGLDVVYSDLASLTFDRDTALDGTPCTVAGSGFEADACAQRISVHGSIWSVGVPVGVLVRPARGVDIGVSYRSGLFGTSRSNVPFIGSGTVTSPDSTTVPVLARTSTHLPHTVLAGVKLDLGSRFDLAVSGRWLHWPGTEVVEVRLARAANVTGAVPERVPLYRGYRDAFSFRALASYRPAAAWRVGLGAILEPPAVDARAVSPAVVEGWRLWGLLLAEVRVARWLTLGAGYGVRALMPRSVQASIYDPFYQVDCAASRYDIPTCRPANVGRGIATAAGDYGSVAHHLGVVTTVQF